MPLSEDEQRILHEMEQKLYENDRSFAQRVRTPRGLHRPMRWSAAIFVVGLAIVLVSFANSLLLATFGFLVMVLAALLFERGWRQGAGRTDHSIGRRARSRS